MKRVKGLLLLSLFLLPLPLVAQQETETAVQKKIIQGISHISDYDEYDTYGNDTTVIIKKRKTVNFEFGATALLGANSHTYGSSSSVKGKSAISYGAGLYTQLNMGVVALRPEVLFERNGAQNPGGRIWVNSITVPLNLRIQTPRRARIGVFGAVGGYYRYALGGKQGGVNIDFKDGLYRHEAGIEWGFGLWVSGVEMGVNFRYGLTSLVRESSSGDMYNRSIQFKMSCKF